MSNKLEQFKIKPGARAPGVENEAKIIAYFSLLLAQDPKIHDFKISSKDSSYGAFNDFVVEIQHNENGLKETAAIQLKQKSGDLISMGSFLTEKGAFSLYKYFKETQRAKIPEGVCLVLLANRKLNIENKKTIKIKNESNIEVNFLLEPVEVKEEEQKGIKRFISSSTSSKVYQFKVTKVGNKGHDKFEKFLKRLYFYSAQYDAKTLEAKLREQFLGQSYEQFLKFVQNWSKEERKFKLNKSTIIPKFMECLLWPYCVNLRGDNSGQEILFDKVFSKFDVTIFEEFTSTLKKYNKKFIEAKKAKVRLKGTLKEEKQFGLSKKTDFIKLLWHLNELPLIIKPDCPKVILSKVLNLLKEEKCGRRLVIVGDIDEGFDNRKFLRNLSDFDGRDLEEYFKDIKINLQGKEWPLVEYVRNDRELARIFRTKEIVGLILDKHPLFLGKPPRDLVPYIGRLLQKPIIHWDVLQDADSDRFVISCNGRKERNFGGQITVFEDSCSAQEFTEICTKNQGENIHHLQITSKDNLAWIATKGNIEKLKKHFLQDEDEVVPDSQIFLSFTNKVNILCANPGMGKSVLLEFLQRNCPKNFWPILINIREHIKTFKENSFDGIVDEVIKRKYQGQDLTRKVVELMKNRGRIVLFWDGLDEAPEEFYESFLEGVQFISGKGYFQWVTSRNHLRDMLERKLNVFALALAQLKKEDQRAYVRKRLKGDDAKIVTLENTFHRDLFETPLQLSILTEIFKNDNNAKDFSSLSDMYCKFVEIKFEAFIAQINPTGDSSIQGQLKLLNKELLPKYQIFGVLACFEGRRLKELKVNLRSHQNFLEEIRKNGDERGLIAGLLEDDTPLFVHQMYAEYFCALYLKENVDQIGKFLLEKLLSDDKFQTIRYMLDLLSANESKSHVAVGRGSVGIIEVDSLPKDNRLEARPILPEDRLVTVLRLQQKDMVEKLIEKGVNLNHKTEQGETFLLLAIKHGLDDIAELLIQKGVNIHAQDENGDSPLHAAAEKGYTDVVKILIEKGVNPNERNKDDNTPLFLALDSSLVHIVKILIEAKADVDISNKKGDTPLTSALKHKKNSFDQNQVNKAKLIVKILTEAGANVNAPDKDGRTPLVLALQFDPQYIYIVRDIVKILTEAEADVNAPDKDGHTPLNLALQSDSQYINIVRDIVKILTEAGADVNAADQDTPLILALKFCKRDIVEEIVKILIDDGADVNTRNKQGDSLLLLAIENKFSSGFINNLIEAGADINARDEYGNTPLSMVKFYGPDEIANRLILENENGINDENLGENLLLRASREGQMDFVKILIGMGVDVNAEAPQGDTSLLLALRYEHQDVAELLIKEGAEFNFRR